MRRELFPSFGLLAFLTVSTIISVCAEAPKGTPRPVEHYALAGLPEQPYNFDVHYKNGTLTVVELAGTKGYVIKPNGPVDAQRRWVWISPMYLGINSSDHHDMPHRNYVEPLLAAGFHVAGIDIGPSCGCPEGVAIYQKLYEKMADDYHLNPKARLLAQSNGGLRLYSWAFRHPDKVDRVFGIYPVTDMRDWPGLNHVVGPQAYPRPGVAYHLTAEELKARLSEFNPIDNLAPLAKAGVKVFHVHGDQDKLVHIELNSIEFGRRYKALGGQFDLQVAKGLGHSFVPPFSQCEAGLKFLLE